jgi:hypothetical protein
MIIPKAHIFLIVVLLTAVLSACGPATSATPSTEPQVGPDAPALEEAPAAGAPALPAGYPAPESAMPATPTLNPNYPAPPTYSPTVDPYPGGLVWVIKPVGVQCEEGTAPGYGDLTEATNSATAAGVRVARSEMTELMVKTSCGSPTSAHYRLQIATEDLQTAVSLGWSEE